MTLETWWLYLGAVVLISCTPGPNVLYVTTRSIRFGLGPAFIGVAGCLTALVLMLTGSVAGLSAVLLALPGAFDVLKIAGAAYLVYLGIQVWREPVAEEAPPPSAGASGATLYRDGFLVGISNPKLLVFAAAF
ncbi:MAG: LysE family translocator, partial [Reyranella sp.]